MAMANPKPYYKTAPPVLSQVQHQTHRFDSLYVHKKFGSTENTAVEANFDNKFAWTNIMDWNLRDGPATSTEAKIVGHARGVEFGAGKGREHWSISFTIVFTDERFKFDGSTLNVQGDIQANAPEGDWAVMGGTGEFAYTQGVVKYKKDLNWNPDSIRELHICVVRLTFPKPNPVQRVEPWGENGRTSFDVLETEQPQRLQSVTIYHDDVIHSIVYFYVDQSGNTRKVGFPSIVGREYELPLGSSETLEKIYGATGSFAGQTVVTSLTFVTNVGTVHGLFGKQSMGNTPFHTVAPDNHSIVGFYGSVGNALNQIGVYVGPN